MLGRRKGLFLFALLALIALALLVRPGQAQKPKAPGKDASKPAPFVASAPIVSRAIGFAETRPVRELLAEMPQNEVERKGEGDEEKNPLNTGDFAKPDPNAPIQTDGALQTSLGVDGHFQINIPAPILTFEGVGVNGGSPPDTNGDVGPNDYVQTVNVRVQIFDKAGVARGPSFLMSTLLQPLGGVCAGNDNGDPVVVYDRIANRWVLTQFAFTAQATPPYHQCVAVSKTGDPTGAYWAYDFVTPGAEFPDYGKFTAWSDAYYFSDRQFTNGATYSGFGVFAMDRTKMLVGDPTASYIYFNAGAGLSNSSSGIVPTQFNGLTPPPPGSPNVFAVYNDDSAGDATDALRLFNFHADFATPSNSTFLERPESPLPVAAFDSRNPSGRADIEEPSPATTADYVDSIGDRLMLRLQYYNRGGVETLTTCHTVNAGTLPAPGVNPTVAQYKAANRYYVLQKTGLTAPYSVLDQGTFSPDANERWMGSTAVDNAGNMALGYSLSSTSVFPSIAYAGRLATDPPNTLSGEQIMFNGTGSQLATSNRWGDYSSMSLDPTDDATFWFTTEYYATSAASAWRTRVGAFKFAGTVAPPQGTLSGTVTACDTGVPIKDALVQVTGGPSTGFSSTSTANGTFSMKLAPGTYSATIVDPSHKCTAIGPFPVTVTNGGTTTLSQCLSGTATFLFQSSAITVNGGNGNGIIESNECNSINVTILNDGCALGKNIASTLSSTTPGVTITQPNSPYPNINENATGGNSVPFAVSTSNSFVCGTRIDFVLTVTFDGGTSTFPFSLNTCQAPPVTINGALVPGTDSTQEGRLGRNFASACGVPKTCPGIFAPTAPRLYRTHTVVNGPGASCVTVQTTPSCPSTTNPILTVAYMNTYVPPQVGNTGTICTNYLGDSATVGTGNSFGFDLPANATLVLVVEEANAGTAGCSGYTLTVNGLVGNTSGPGPCPAPPTAASRKDHGGAGMFSVPLPLTGPSGVEDRVGNGGVAGSHTVVLSFPTNPTGATASVIADNPSSGTGTVSGVTYSGNDMLINLTNVSDRQVLTLSVTGGSVSPAVVPIGFLVGDVNSSRSVSSTDISQVKSAASPGTVNGTNFRADVNANGMITSTDLGIVKAAAGNTVP